MTRGTRQSLVIAGVAAVLAVLFVFTHRHEPRAPLPFAYFHDPADGQIVCPHCGRAKQYTVTYSASDKHFNVPHLDYQCSCSKREEDGWSTGPWMGIPTEAQWNAYQESLHKSKSKPR